MSSPIAGCRSIPPSNLVSSPVRQETSSTESISSCSSRICLKTTKTALTKPPNTTLVVPTPRMRCTCENALLLSVSRRSLRFSLEFYVSLEQIKDIFDNFEKWTKPESAEFSIYFTAKPQIRKEPKGVVLIFVPFNYPIMLLMSPLVRPSCYPLWFLCVA